MRLTFSEHWGINYPSYLPSDVLGPWRKSSLYLDEQLADSPSTPGEPEHKMTQAQLPLSSELARAPALDHVKAPSQA